MYHLFVFLSFVKNVNFFLFMLNRFRGFDNLGFLSWFSSAYQSCEGIFEVVTLVWRIFDLCSYSFRRINFWRVIFNWGKEFRFLLNFCFKFWFFWKFFMLFRHKFNFGFLFNFDWFRFLFNLRFFLHFGLLNII